MAWSRYASAVDDFDFLIKFYDNYLLRPQVCTCRRFLRSDEFLCFGVDALLAVTRFNLLKLI